MPRITIGVPVYNGVTLIGECLENLACQTHRDFEVIISDNASTDGTTEICAAFCEYDRRFRHIVHPKTSSANENFCMSEIVRIAITSLSARMMIWLHQIS